MEARLVTAGAIDFRAFIDGQMWSFAGESKDGWPFFCAEFAGSGAKRLDAGNGITLPEDFDLDSDMGSDFVWFCSWWDKRRKVRSKGIRAFVFYDKTADISYMLLDACFYLLLCASNVLLPCLEAVGLVNYNGVSAFTKVWATTFGLGSTVARAIHEIERGEVLAQF